MADSSNAHGLPFFDARCDPAEAALWLSHLSAITNSLAQKGEESKEEMVDISSSRFEDIISAANITRLVMEVAPEVLQSLAEGYTDDPAMKDLCERFMFFKDHLRSYTMQYPSYHTQLVSDCMFTAVKRIMAKYPERDVTVVPDFDLTEPRGHPVTINPDGSAEVKVRGHVSHVILHHPAEYDLKQRLLYDDEGPGVITALTERRDISCVIIIDAKEIQRTGVGSHRSEVIGAALALIARTSLSEVRTVIANGQHWLFGMLSVRDGHTVYNEFHRVYVQSASPDPSQRSRKIAHIELSRVVGLLACWIDGVAPFVGK
ncbi:hypothetical protein K466DRAFT_665572 [Polyporus arcularius HHB13444]|uniref:Uncharacterized protein n=1 Tax=Polyporus arcularius HHB13444 TaxID=1314778 RepID=A0A5C3P2V4_9APHY|nr:hypothetical protein K466DRAFT_665572 [Polyporus arcularius HHB13444]